MSRSWSRNRSAAAEPESREPSPPGDAGASAPAVITPEPPPPGRLADDDEQPPRRLSFVRLAALVVILAGLGLVGFNWTRAALAPTPARSKGTWFAPYVDTTLTPTYPFESASAQPARQVALGFVVADRSGSCTPSWGAAYSLDQADQALSMSARIAQIGVNGARAIVSFGGQANTPLATACPTVAALINAYSTVIQRYSLTVIDLDVEGAALGDAASIQRNAQAVRALQGADPKLQVWLTLPVEPSGLQDNALGVIDAMLAARVDLAGVNIMSMDFTGPLPSGSGMIGPVEQSLRAAHDQLAAAFRQRGVTLNSLQVWEHLGTTVMIGENDITGERFTVGDARGLVAFASRVGLGRVSMWSINRDSQCGSVFSVTGVHSNTCSGTPQSTLGFSHIFAGLGGVAPQVVGSAAVATLPPQPDTNPADAPYPIWSATEPYPQGYKVVENGLIYEALYYNSGSDPSAQAQTGAQGPWQLVGPVLPGDHAPKLTTLPAGTYPAWSPGTAYHTGDRVLLNRLPYAAKWNNQGASPGTGITNPYSTPWKPLFTFPGEPAQP